MKFKNILIPVLLGLSLTACNDDSSFTGTYQSDDKVLLQITASKSNDKEFVVDTKVTLTLDGRTNVMPYRVVAYKKDNSLYKLNDDSLVGTIEKDSFTLSKSGITYKKKL